MLPVDTIAKVRDDAPFDPICYIGCGATTGLRRGVVRSEGRARQLRHRVRTRRHRSERRAGRAARRCQTIIGVDTNPDKESIARRFGATEFVDPRKVERLTSHLMKLTGGADYTFECIGSPQVMRQAFECTNPRGARAT